MAGKDEKDGRTYWNSTAVRRKKRKKRRRKKKKEERRRKKKEREGMMENGDGARGFYIVLAERKEREIFTGNKNENKISGV